MKIIIVGCGRLGSGLAGNLTAKGHAVTVIDIEPEAFAHLNAGFGGNKLTGIGFDKEVLEQAGIRRADAVVACTNSDEANALIGRISRNIYRVPKVISRLYDPRKAELYKTLGIQTISTTSWGIEHATELLSYNQLDNVMSIGNGQVQLLRLEIPELMIGRPVGELAVTAECQVVALSRENKTFIPTMGTAMKKHDVVYLAIMDAYAARLKSMLGLE
jgi:trk system potassium uptake protein TrkA